MKIFISNLAPEVTPHDLFVLFSAYGSVAAAYAQVAKDNNPATYGYVHMKNAAQSGHAVTSLNKTVFM